MAAVGDAIARARLAPPFESSEREARQMTQPRSPEDLSAASRPKDRASGLPGRVTAERRRLAGAARARFEGSSVQIFLRRLGALDFGGSIVLFGAAVLLSVLPFIILMGSLANSRVDDDLSRHIGLNRQGALIVSHLFKYSRGHSTAAIVTALILAIAGTMGVAGSVQLIYERIFGLPHRGWRDALRFFAWTAVLLGFLVADSLIIKPVRAVGGPLAQQLVTFAGAAAFFWWTMHFLLAGRVPWRLLVRPAIVTALFWIGLDLFSSLYFSSQIVSDSRLYGTIGVVFSLMTWFIAIGAVIALGAAVGASWDQRRGRSGAKNN
jgi:membrane protein